MRELPLTRCRAVARFRTLVRDDAYDDVLVFSALVLAAGVKRLAVGRWRVWQFCGFGVGSSALL